MGWRLNQSSVAHDLSNHAHVMEPPYKPKKNPKMELESSQVGEQVKREGEWSPELGSSIFSHASPYASLPSGCH